ncbi:hypothetical protein RJ639_000974 [Escallonia herrerae]|uniref:Uncharacterized protein n=1 Tax=Escallonia herrerae TaxID=1293975 RepID=A0AA88XAC1_9ASTE|nr:hypothetical protein RJ639_000974 [Escallonia herrerae]
MPQCCDLDRVPAPRFPRVPIAQTPKAVKAPKGLSRGTRSINHLPTIQFTTIVGRARVPDGGELVRRGVGGQPLLHREELLGTGDVGAGGGHLHVVDVPPVVRAGTVGGQVHGANRAGQTRASAAEDVEVTPLEVVVARAHQPAPGLQIVDAHAVAVSVVQG